jgi:AbrB family looped-hinge helix DNA binding protein
VAAGIAPDDTLRFAEQYLCQTEHMKATVTINSRGVVTLPAKLRQALGIQANDQLIAETTSDGLLLRRAVPVEVYTPDREREFDDAEAELADALKGKSAVRPAAKSTRRRRRS